MEEDGRIARLKRQSRARLGGELDRFETPYDVLASPGWRGVEAETFLSSSGGRSEIIKSYLPETDFYINVPASLHAAQNAASMGIGPQITEQDPKAGVLVMEYLGDGWRVAGLHDAVNGKTRMAVINAKKRFQAGPACLNDGDPFNEIHKLADIVKTLGLLCPPHLSSWLTFADEVGARINALGKERRPCHRDGNISNVMLGPAGEMRLLDYDLAANADPYEDLGSFLMEMFDSTATARGGFEEWMGYFNEGEFYRAMAYGILDDLRWGLIGVVMSARSQRRALEFSKCASWRLLRFVDQMAWFNRQDCLLAMV